MTREERVFFPVERTGPARRRPARNDTSHSRPLVLFETKRCGSKHNFKQLQQHSTHCTNACTDCTHCTSHRFKSVCDCLFPAFSLWTESAAPSALIPRSLRSLHHPPDGTLVHHHPAAAYAAASALRAHALRASFCWTTLRASGRAPDLCQLSLRFRPASVDSRPSTLRLLPARCLPASSDLANSSQSSCRRAPCLLQRYPPAPSRRHGCGPAATGRGRSVRFRKELPTFLKGH